MKTLQPRVAMLEPPKRGGWNDPRRGTRQQRGYGAAWDAKRLVILKRDHYLCQTCKREGFSRFGNIVDHKVNKAEGGTDDDDNLETICRDHHKIKTQAEAARGRSYAPPDESTTKP